MYPGSGSEGNSRFDDNYNSNDDDLYDDQLNAIRASYLRVRAVRSNDIEEVSFDSGRSQSGAHDLVDTEYEPPRDDGEEEVEDDEEEYEDGNEEEENNEDGEDEADDEDDEDEVEEEDPAEQWCTHDAGTSAGPSNEPVLFLPPPPRIGAPDPLLDPPGDDRPNSYLHYFDGKEKGVEDFRRKFNIPADVFIRRVSREAVVHDADHITIPILAITEGGLQFPLNRFVREVLCAFEIPPFDLAINTYRIINSAARLTSKFGLKFQVHDLFLPYFMNSNAHSGRRYFSVRRDYDHIVRRLPDSDKWANDYLEVYGNYDLGAREHGATPVPTVRPRDRPSKLSVAFYLCCF